MRLGIYLGPVYALAIGLAVPCFGQAQLVLTPTVADLDQLQVDSPVMFLVELTSLPAGAGLDSLFTTVEYDSGLLGVATLTPGGALPNPFYDQFDFATLAQPGLVDGAFTTLGTEPLQHISQTGVFFSFTLTPTAAGSGSIGISFADASQFNASNPNEPILVGATPSDALSFTVIGDVPGDYNLDGVVDAADYTVWRDQLGNTGSPGIPADGSGPTSGSPDGVVDQFDYIFWKSQFGNAANGSLITASSSKVPEASTLSLALLSAVAMILAQGLGDVLRRPNARVCPELGATA